eukprot:1554650-Lingulodinium_polyedra.AAC.1
MVRVDVTLCGEPAGQCWHARRPRRFDRAKAVAPGAAEAFAGALAEVAPIPWELDVHSHAHLLAGQLGSAAAAAFPLEAAQ